MDKCDYETSINRTKVGSSATFRLQEPIQIQKRQWEKKERKEEKNKKEIKKSVNYYYYIYYLIIIVRP